MTQETTTGTEQRWWQVCLQAHALWCSCDNPVTHIPKEWLIITPDADSGTVPDTEVTDAELLDAVTAEEER